MKNDFNNENAVLISSMQETTEKNKSMIMKHAKQWERSTILIAGIAIIFVAIHDLNRWASWSMYLGAIAVTGLLAGIIAYVYGYWNKPKIEEPERVKLNELAKNFLIKKSLPALLSKLTNDGYVVSYAADVNSPSDFLNEGEYIKPDGSLIDGQIMNSEKMYITKGGIKFVLSKWAFNDNDFDIEAKIVTGAIKI
ncbi:MAG: hypothetical protein WCP92_06515 [bacterium]